MQLADQGAFMVLPVEAALLLTLGRESKALLQRSLRLRGLDESRIDRKRRPQVGDAPVGPHDADEQSSRRCRSAGAAGEIPGLVAHAEPLRSAHVVAGVELHTAGPITLICGGPWISRNDPAAGPTRASS
jgi:hypothetical protein